MATASSNTHVLLTTSSPQLALSTSLRSSPDSDDQASPAHLEYVLSTYMNPSMPDLHFTYANQHFLVDGLHVSWEQGLDFLQGKSLSLRLRLRLQRVPAAFVGSVLPGSYTEDIWRVVMSAITWRMEEIQYGLRAAEAAHSSATITPVLRRWAERARDALNVAASILLEPFERAARTWHGTT